MTYLDPLASYRHWAHKYEPYSNNWYYHQTQLAAFVRGWRATQTLTLV